MKRVVVVGGGMAGLAAAWRLSSPEHRDDVEVTVYERSWQLGGKGASGRGPQGRILEHGLHVWLGYYDNAFRLMREVYDDLSRTDPECPVRTWRDAFTPSSVVGVEDWDGDSWHHWVAQFAVNDRLPGQEQDRSAATTSVRFVEQATRLLAEFGSSLGAVDSSSEVALSGSAEPPQARWPGVGPRDARRLRELTGLVLACLRGTTSDGLLWRPDGFETIDALDFRDWLRRHGASEETCQSAIVRGFYDLVFAYEEGDRSRPRFSAGLGLFLATRFFFDYKGAIFWRMNAGMGDVVFAPLYQALSARGVQIRLMHRLDHVRLSEDGRRVVGLDFTRLGDVSDPLVTVKGLAVFPAESPAELAEDRTALSEKDFDSVVLATSVGALPSSCSELLDRSARWRCMVDQIGTVATRSAQLWLGPGDDELGWAWPGATMSAYDEPFDTFASMTHLLPAEDWGPDGPRSLAYLCAAVPDGLASSGQAAADTSARVDEFLAKHGSHFWPDAGDDPGVVRARYERTNTDASDRYVQSLPGSATFRLQPDESGFEDLVLAGDWTNCGLNAGCIEAATMSGLEAANVVLGRPLMDDLLGDWYGVRA